MAGNANHPKIRDPAASITPAANKPIATFDAILGSKVPLTRTFWQSNKNGLQLTPQLSLSFLSRQ